MTGKRILVLALFCLWRAGAAADYDLLIQNARIIDGTGNPWFRGAVAVKNGKIADILPVETTATAARVVDARGHYVAPGFIDVHTHCEDDFSSSPTNLAENFARMGVTTVITGNCGSSEVDIGEEFTSFTQFGMGINVASLIGHNSIRRRVMGNVARDPSTTEIAAMKALIEKGMRDGAVGFSTGLIYNPGQYSKTPEVIELAKSAAKYNGVYATHMRSEGQAVKEAIAEALAVGKGAHIPVEISHFKITAPKKFGQSTQTLGMVIEARKSGIDVNVDQYAYTASSTGLGTILPDWASEGSQSVVRARLRDPATRRKIRNQIIRERRDESGRPDMSYANVASFRADPSINGMNIKQIAEKWKHDTSWESQIDVALDMLTSGGAGMVFHSMSEADVQNIMQYPNTMVASDSGVRRFGAGVPHPRGYGDNARILARYVRDLKVLRLEDAVRKMTSLPANRFRFFDRGILRPGMAADIVVFDLNKVQDLATFEKPHAYAAGFEQVIVNGRFVIDDGKLTQATPGQIIYGPGKGMP
jgi:N-acyl-D-amino-acid deacylase